MVIKWTFNFQLLNSASQDIPICGPVTVPVEWISLLVGCSMDEVWTTTNGSYVPE